MDNDMQLRLGDIAQVIMGQSPQSQYFNSNGQGKPFLQGNRTFGSKFPTYDTFTTAITKLGHKNSVVMSVRAPVGELNVLSEDTCLGRGVCALNLVDPSIDPDFLFYALKGNSERLKAKQSGTVFGSINKSDIESLILELPDKAEWNAIAKFLGDIDRKILVNEQINKNLEEQLIEFYKAWFIGFEFNSGVQPTSWKTQPLNELTSLVSKGRAPEYSDDSKHLVLNQKCIRNHSIDFNIARRHSPRANDPSRLSYGDILINSTGTGTLGRVAQFWVEKTDVSVDSHITIVRPIKREFLEYLGLWAVNNESIFVTMATGSTGQSDLPRERLENMMVLVPDNQTLSTFSEITQPMIQMLVHNRSENIYLQGIRDSLLPKLLSGEIEIR